MASIIDLEEDLLKKFADLYKIDFTSLIALNKIKCLDLIQIRNQLILSDYFKALKTEQFESKQIMKKLADNYKLSYGAILKIVYAKRSS